MNLWFSYLWMCPFIVHYSSLCLSILSFLIVIGLLFFFFLAFTWYILFFKLPTSFYSVIYLNISWTSSSWFSFYLVDHLGLLTGHFTLFWFDSNSGSELGCNSSFCILCPHSLVRAKFLVIAYLNSETHSSRLMSSALCAILL